MANIKDIKEDIESSGQFTFSRSGGPGGQNVNKVNTSVLLVVCVSDLKSLTLHEQSLVYQKLSGRINSKEQIYIKSNEHRNQLKNREAAVERMALLIYESVKKVPTRHSTKPTRASVERRINNKKRKSYIKASRGKNFTKDF
ncbi:MAG: alternative ribosome rescue aminoacyl-tRNA hydrolase ArfB [Spirochaetales bacterium]|nr:alternative ribosome rescue aminoacyl-tRNA hydrolase ArfB [Spirochaetales bacterium]